LAQRVSLGATDRKLVVDVVKIRSRYGGHADFLRKPARSEQLPVTVRAILPLCFPTVEVSQFHAENRGLYRVKPAVHADHFVVILFSRAVHPQDAELVGQFATFGRDQAPVSGSAQILGGKEAKAPVIADRSDIPSLVLGADGLR